MCLFNFVFLLLLDYKLHEGEGHVCIAHCCTPSAQQRPQHMADASYTFTGLRKVGLNAKE